MYNFFIENIDAPIITGSDYNHIKNVLRLKIGEEILVSYGGKNNLCKIESFENETVKLSIIKENFKDTTLPIEVWLFQGMPKGDKMELIIQKAVELGVSKIIPVAMKRCIAKIEDNKKSAKTARFNAISESASKQCKASIIPEVLDIMPYNSAIELAKTFDHLLIPFENESGMNSTVSALKEIKAGDKVAIFIGSEGGFDQTEIDFAIKNNATTISLGKRILRTETAAITTLSMLMLYAEIKL